MGNRGFGVRLFEIQSDGALEPLLGVDEDYFAGTVPNVGDTFAKWGLNDVYSFYSVQRRYFIDSPDADNGWCVLVRPIESASQLESVVEAWTEDTRFWMDIDDQEKAEERVKTRKKLEEIFAKKGKKPAPSADAPPGKKPRKPRKRILKPRPPKK